MATSPGLLDFIGQVKPTIDNHPTHHQAEGETIFLEGFTASGIVAFFETFFHHGMDYDRTTEDGNQPRNKPPDWSRIGCRDTGRWYNPFHSTGRPRL